MQINDMKRKEYSSFYVSKSEEETSKKGKEQTKSSFFAGNVFGNDQGLLMSEKKAKAQKSALRVLLKQHEDVMKVDKKEEDLLTDQSDMTKTARDKTELLDWIGQERDAIKEKYNIKKNDKNDLALLDKQDRIADGSGEKLTLEEEGRMSQLTEYAIASKRLDDATKEVRKTRDGALSSVISDNLTMYSMKTNRGKDQGMMDAQEKADDIMKESTKEIVAYLYTQIKDTIDEKKADADKKEEDTTKKEQEEQDKIESAKANSTNPSVLENVAQQAQTADDGDIDKVQMKSLIKQDVKNESFQTEVKKLIKQEKILLDDVKGIQVDEEV